jgi:alkyldihydroxyacetonephosphate synthase
MIAAPRRDAKWWGWGDPAVEPELDAEALATLRERIGELRPAPRAAELEGFELPEPAPLPAALGEAVGADGVFATTEDRVRHATGCGYLDLVRLRSGRLAAAPDAVLLPPDREALRRVLEVCAAEGVAVVPFGGGTSVVGGVEPLRGPHERLVSLDLARLRDVEVDRGSLTARLGAGLRGPEAEAALAAQGFVLGHFPQSFEYATIGGFAATRSAKSRAATAASTPWSRRCGWSRRRASCTRWRRRTAPPARPCASSSSARRASSARSPR